MCQCKDHTRATYGLSIADAVLAGIALVLQILNGILCKKKKSATVALAGVAAGVHGPAFIFNIPIVAFRNDIFTHGNCPGFPPVVWPVLALVCGILSFGLAIAFAVVSGARASKNKTGGASGKVTQGAAAVAVATPGPAVAVAPAPVAYPATPGQVPMQPYPGAPVQDPYAAGAQPNPYAVYPGTEMTNYAAAPAPAPYPGM